ncbi:hypothetical protein PPUJ20066_15230 [Pseudomonas putida]|nr:hypothetical protein PPUJ20066_15230 [Pseudomonas putida]
MATTQGIQRAVTGSSGVRSGMTSSFVCAGLFAGQARSHRISTALEWGDISVGAGLPRERAANAYHNVRVRRLTNAPGK